MAYTFEKIVYVDFLVHKSFATVCFEFSTMFAAASRRVLRATAKFSRRSIVVSAVKHRGRRCILLQQPVPQETSHFQPSLFHSMPFSTETSSETTRHSFQAETSQLLDIVSRSLYTDKEVFIRELISNASDALEKVRHRLVSGEATEDSDAELRIDINVDSENRSITIQDSGIGLSESELHKCLGTIAKSGTKEFMQQATATGGGSGIGENLIGQFGVGFYSAFMVADTVNVYTKSANPDDSARLWSSSGLQFHNYVFELHTILHDWFISFRSGKQFNVLSVNCSYLIDIIVLCM